MSIDSPYAARLAGIDTRRDEVAVLGSLTRYWTYGPADAATTVVIAHGYRGEHHGIEPIIAQLPHIRFVSPDLPGFGESTPMTAAGHTVDGYSAWFTAFIEAVGLAPTALVLGHSFGSIVVASAVANGLDTAAVILVNPIAISGLAGPRKVATKVTVAFYDLAGRVPARLGHRLLNSWVVVQLMSSTMAKTKDRALRRWIHREHHTFFSRYANRDVVVDGFRASVSTDVSAFAPRIAAPVLLIAARLDDITPISAQFDLQRLLPDATLSVLEDVGHLIHYEKPREAAEAIVDFLARRGLDTPAP
ncbi:MAG: alpha/beta hydrolase [Burkholderiaceae bacterium]|nr:alpha/beta hydrolase [Microbacteriaceae bacterium]